MAQEMGVTVRTIYRYETTGAPARALKLAQRIYKEQTQRSPA
jgi:DNA-binding transcriptional MerR regulator